MWWVCVSVCVRGCVRASQTPQTERKWRRYGGLDNGGSAEQILRTRTCASLLRLFSCVQAHDLRALAKKAVRSNLSRMSKQLNMDALQKIGTPHDASAASIDSDLHGEASGKAALALFQGEHHKSDKLGLPPPLEYVP